MYAQALISFSFRVRSFFERLPLAQSQNAPVVKTAPAAERAGVWMQALAQTAAAGSMARRTQRRAFFQREGAENHWNKNVQSSLGIELPRETTGVIRRCEGSRAELC